MEPPNVDDREQVIAFLNLLETLKAPNHYTARDYICTECSQLVSPSDPEKMRCDEHMEATK